jgi:hypothetical protein
VAPKDEPKSETKPTATIKPTPDNRPVMGTFCRDNLQPSRGCIETDLTKTYVDEIRGTDEDDGGLYTWLAYVGFDLDALWTIETFEGSVWKDEAFYDSNNQPVLTHHALTITRRVATFTLTASMIPKLTKKGNPGVGLDDGNPGFSWIAGGQITITHFSSKVGKKSYVPQKEATRPVITCGECPETRNYVGYRSEFKPLSTGKPFTELSWKPVVKI